MHNFLRVLRISLRHKATVAASLFCSLMVAVLWVGNIAPLYWVVDVVMLDKSLPQWLEEGQTERRAQIVKLDEQIAERNDELKRTSAAERSRVEYQIAHLEDEQAGVRKKFAWYESILPAARRYLPTTPFRTLLVVCAWVFIGTVLKSLFRVAGAYFTSRIGHLVAFDLRKEFYRRTLRLDLATFRQTSAGDLLNRFAGDVQTAAMAAQNVYGMVIREPMKMIGCLAVAAWVSWQLLLITLISAPLAGYAIGWLAKALKRANRKAIENMSSVYERLNETFTGVKAIKAFTQESRERGRFHRTSKQFYKRSMRIALYDSLVAPTTEMAGIGIAIAAALCGGYLVLNHQTHLFGVRISSEPLTHGLMTLFFGMLAGASDPVRRLTSVFNSLQQGAAAADHLYELLDRETLIKNPARPLPLPRQLGRLEFRDVSFAYNAVEPVLDHINLVVEPGETIAIVGPNGCGKSTLTNLVPRFYDPASGSVWLNGVDVRDVRLRELRDRIGVVTQETLLFNDTVAANILYGRPSASQAEIVEAARRAHADRFITDVLSDGYQTVVGPGGNRLSGGQRQRISLARAILRDPQILILDEATSQIDVESERLIHDVLAEFTRGRTALIITHRPSTLELADRIVVMEAGRIVDVGDYGDLASRCALFRRLAHVELRESA
jgi:ATP-binding cassette subfamily B protein/subfamily B ATP-binding cassette protein MsbA